MLSLAVYMLAQMMDPIRLVCAIAAGASVRPWWGAASLSLALEAVLFVAFVAPAAHLMGRQPSLLSAACGAVAMLLLTTTVWAIARRIRIRRAITAPAKESGRSE